MELPVMLLKVLTIALKVATIALNADHKLAHISAKNNVDACSGEDADIDACVTGAPMARKIAEIVNIVNNLNFIKFNLL